MDLNALKQAIGTGRTVVTGHAFIEMLADGIADEQEIWSSILATGELLEDYPTASRGACCLLLCSLPDGRPLHTVVAYPSPRVAAQLAVAAAAVLITVYRPDQHPHEWSADYRTRLLP